ncbi:IS110 family transposase [Azospirillum sp. CT11-132]|uniref:IS110 family transposase n=1 Tax=Azospirillum sp. CT11-132 TaxID=3396317 RepID=UPI0039A5F5B5
MSTIEMAAGIDCGKRFLDVAVSATGDTIQVANTPSGHQELAAWLAHRGITDVGIEASGGYERPVRDALRAASLSVRVFDPARVRFYAKAMGRRAKNDTIDAALIAAFTASGAASTATPVDPTREELAGLVKARRLLVDKRGDLRRALISAPAAAKAALEEAIDALTEALTTLEAAIERTLATVPVMAETVAALQTAPGVGPVVAIGLAALLPELGHTTGWKVAALVGVAPFDHDSGQAHGRRRIGGGRPDVRRILYMAAAVAALHTTGVIADHYAQLTKRGKPPKLALVACMHKLIVRLNAMLAKGRTWEIKTA